MNQKTKNILIISVSILIIILLIFFSIKFFSNKNVTKENTNQTPKQHFYTKEEKLDILDKNKPQEELTPEKKQQLIDKLDSITKNDKNNILDKLDKNKAKKDEIKKIEKLDLLKNQ